MNAICPSCGASLPDGAGACAGCGAPAPARGNTLIEKLPPNETGPASITFDRAEPRWFGVAPAEGLLLLAAIALAAAIAVFVVGSWPVGIVLIGVTLLLLAAFAEAAKRRADSPLARVSFDALRTARERAGVAMESAAARSRAGREGARLRQELFAIQQERRAKMADLGAAAYAEDDDAAARLKAEIAQLDQAADEKEIEIQAIVERARAGIERARLTVQKTEMIELPPEPGPPPDEGNPPEPARIPEPYPPPDEGTPPDPARIPEPYPPPDETTPPQPDPGNARTAR